MFTFIFQSLEPLLCSWVSRSCPCGMVILWVAPRDCDSRRHRIGVGAAAPLIFGFRPGATRQHRPPVFTTSSTPEWQGANWTVRCWMFFGISRTSFWAFSLPKAFSVWSLADENRVPFGALIWVDAVWIPGLDLPGPPLQNMLWKGSRCCDTKKTKYFLTALN